MVKRKEKTMRGGEEKTMRMEEGEREERVREDSNVKKSN